MRLMPDAEPVAREPRAHRTRTKDKPVRFTSKERELYSQDTCERREVVSRGGRHVEFVYTLAKEVQMCEKTNVTPDIKFARPGPLLLTLQ